MRRDAMEHAAAVSGNFRRRAEQHQYRDEAQVQLAAAWAASIPELYRFKPNVCFDCRGGAIILPPPPQGIVDKWFEVFIKLHLTEEQLKGASTLRAVR